MPDNLPPWAAQLVEQYESNAANQFIIFGNINDRMLIPGGTGLTQSAKVGTLTDFRIEVLLPSFDVVLSYDLGNGIRIEKGGAVFSQWPAFQEQPNLPKTPRAAVETLTHYLRYTANLARLKQQRSQVAVLIKNADLVMPQLSGGFDYDIGAMASLIRDWASDSMLAGHPLATFLLTENLNDLNPLLANNPRAARIKVGLPGPEELARAYQVMATRYPVALREYSAQLEPLARQLSGATLGATESLFKSREFVKKPLEAKDLVSIKKQIVEKDSSGLIEFLETTRTLDDLHGQDAIKQWLRQDITLWKNNDLSALPKGYLFCGPVGTGKTFMVECLAGEAGVPVVKLKNFRDRWVGSTEGNLERIFRLLQALGRCYVFVDEADQALGRRESGNDSGVGGRVYSMIAEEMGSSTSRGRIIWILASSRPDLIEVDLKRPGRVDVKIPLFPTCSPEESFRLIRGLCKSRGLAIEEAAFSQLKDKLPLLLTPGAAEALASRVYRLSKTQNLSPVVALEQYLADYRPPVSPQILADQIRLAAAEASDVTFVPEFFHPYLPGRQ
jgi:hypothetical protein